VTLRRLLPLPLVLLAAFVGYGAGALLTARSIDRADPTGPGDGAAARAALATLRSHASRTPPDTAALGAARRAFLERWPDSWLRRRWQAPRR